MRKSAIQELFLVMKEVGRGGFPTLVSHHLAKDLLDGTDVVEENS